MTHHRDLCRSHSTHDQRVASTLLAAPARETEYPSYARDRVNGRARSTAGPNKVQSQFDRRLRNYRGPSSGRALFFSAAAPLGTGRSRPGGQPGPNKNRLLVLAVRRRLRSIVRGRWRLRYRGTQRIDVGIRRVRRIDGMRRRGAASRQANPHPNENSGLQLQAKRPGP